MSTDGLEGSFRILDVVQESTGTSRGFSRRKTQIWMIGMNSLSLRASLLNSPVGMEDRSLGRVQTRGK